MKKLESTFLNMVLVLTVITLIAAGTLGTLHSVTKEPIELSKIAKQEAAIQEVLTSYDKLDEPIDINGMKVYKAYQNGAFVGAAVESSSKMGFSGDVRVMVGFDKDGNIINYAILEQKETPGLGTKMVDWFKTDRDNRSVIGKNPANDKLIVTKDGGSVDAITAATISSRAFLDAINNGYQAYAAADTGADELDYVSGATPSLEGDTIVEEEAMSEPTDSINIENN